MMSDDTFFRGQFFDVLLCFTMFYWVHQLSRWDTHCWGHTADGPREGQGPRAGAGHCRKSLEAWVAELF